MRIILASTAALLERLNTPETVSALGLEAGEWAGYHLGKPLCRKLKDASDVLSEVVDHIVEENLQPMELDDVSDDPSEEFVHLLQHGYATDYVPGQESTTTIWIFSEDWFSEDLWAIYFNNFNHGLLSGASKACKETSEENKSTNVIPLWR